MQLDAPEREQKVEDALEVPEKTVPEMDPVVETKKAAELAKLIDLHLDYERQSRMPLSVDELTPRRLCPEQRTDLVTDLYAVTR